MSISNPTTQFISGSQTESFIYEGGDKLYHFSSIGVDEANCCTVNTVFFANSKLHAKDVLQRMFQHIIKCNKQYIECEGINGDEHGFCVRAELKILTYQRLLHLLANGTVKIIEAPNNQFYQVSWAENDVF